MHGMELNSIALRHARTAALVPPPPSRSPCWSQPKPVSTNSTVPMAVTHALSARRQRGLRTGQIVGSGPTERERHEEWDVVPVLAPHGTGPAAVCFPRSAVVSVLVPHAASVPHGASLGPAYVVGCNDFLFLLQRPSPTRVGGRVRPAGWWRGAGLLFRWCRAAWARPPFQFPGTRDLHLADEMLCGRQTVSRQVCYVAGKQSADKRSLHVNPPGH